MEEKNKLAQNSREEEDVIDIAEIIAVIWYKRRTILLVTAIFVVLGFIEAMSSTPQYRARARVATEVSGVAGFAGGVISEYDILQSSYFPEIVSSTTMMYRLLDKEVQPPGLDGPVTLLCYLQEHMNEQSGTQKFFSTLRMFTTGLPRTLMGLPGTIRGWLRGSGEEQPVASGVQSDEEPAIIFGGDEEVPAIIVEEHKEGSDVIYGEGEEQMMRADDCPRSRYWAMRRLSGRISHDIDRWYTVLSINSDFPHPQVAAQVTQHVLDYLHDFLVMSQVSKAMADLRYLEERYEEREQELYDAQMALARFQDANRYVVSSAIRTEEQRLEHQYNLRFTLFNEVATKLEFARIRVQEDTPVLQLIEEVQIPMEASGSGRSRTLILFTLIGGVVGVAYVFGRRMAVKLIQQVKEYESKI